MAGSFGYVAPEVLKKTGHGKPVDIWSTGIITYVLLCGYSPFRANNTKTLIQENTEAKIDFQARYWTKVSDQAKNFIRRLAAADPDDRPTAQDALHDPWMKLEDVEVGEEHDLSAGLKENFDAKGKWRSAFYGLTAVHRFGSASRTSTRSSGGWAKDEGKEKSPIDNANTGATPPQEGEGTAAGVSKPNKAHELKREQDGPVPLHKRDDIEDKPGARPPVLPLANHIETDTRTASSS